MSSPFLEIKSAKKLAAIVFDFEAEEGTIVNGRVRLHGEWYSLAGLKPAFEAVKANDTISIEPSYTPPAQIEEIIEQTHNTYIVGLTRLMFNSLLERRIISAGDIYGEFESGLFPGSNLPGIPFEEQPFNLMRAFSVAWHTVKVVSK